MPPLLIVKSSIAKNVLIENKEKLHFLAERLLTREVVFTDDLEEILGKRKYSNPRIDEILELNKNYEKTNNEEVEVVEKEKKSF